MKAWPVVVACAMLAGTWGVKHTLSHGEPIPVKQPFSLFPLAIGERWQGKPLQMELRILDELKVSDYLLRVYGPTTRAVGDRTTPVPVWLYVGYYQSQRTGVSYHSPKNCLPGSGWQFVESEFVTIPVSSSASVTINKAVIQKGLDRQLILYWYQDRGRVIASEYWAKGYLIWDAMTKNRSDGALVRITVPVVTTVDEAFEHGKAFLHDLWPLLPGYLPSGEAV